MTWAFWQSSKATNPKVRFRLENIFAPTVFMECTNDSQYWNIFNDTILFEQVSPALLCKKVRCWCLGVDIEV